MKKLITLLLTILVTTSFVLADGKGPCSVSVTDDGGNAYLYKLDADDWGEDLVWTDFKANNAFAGTDFGTPTSLTLNGGTGSGWGPSYDSSTAFKLEYQVYLASETAPSIWASIALTTRNDERSKNSNSRHEKLDANVDILALASTPGLYKFAVRVVHPSGTTDAQIATFSIPGSDNLDFSVTVPAGTQNCYIKEDGANTYVPMTLTNDKYTATIENISADNYRYNYYTYDATDDVYLIETDATGNVVAARSHAASDVVEDWIVLESITIKFKKPADWAGVSLWAWTSEDLFPPWPGQTLTEADGWYGYTFAKKYQNINLLFSSGGPSPEFQTVNVESVTASTCYQTDGTTGDEGKLNVQTTPCSDPSGLQTNEFGDVTIYSGKSFLYVETPANNATVTLYSIDGKLLSQKIQNETIVQFSDLKAGIYIVKVNNNSYKVFVK